MRHSKGLAGLVTLLGLLTVSPQAEASITSDGFGNNFPSICSQGGSVGFGLDSNNGLTWTNSTWRCVWATSFVSNPMFGGLPSPQGNTGDQSNLPIGTPLRLHKLDVNYPDFGTSSRPSLTKVEWDTNNDGDFDIVDNGPFAYGQNACCSMPMLYQIDGQLTFAEAGNKTIRLRVSRSDASTETVSGTVTVVEDTTTAAIARTLTLGGASAGSSPVLEGASVYLSAGSSTAVSGVISKYEWDLNGDGSYEVDSGSSATHTTSFAEAGTKTVGVRVTSRGGSTSSTTASIEVRKAPPSGEPGLSIRNGASYTNTKAVQLNLVWPEYATEARISNDGGFAASKTQTVPLATSVSWELDDSVSGVFTKVVYVRFSGSGVDTTKTYSDDIILDTTAPTIETSAATADGSAVAVALKASDDITGVDDVQVKSDTATVTKDYATSLTVPTSDLGLVVETSSVSTMATSTTLQVRVSDKAGNWTEWKSLNVSGLKSGSAAKTPAGATTAPSANSGTATAPRAVLSAGSNAKYVALAKEAKLALSKNAKISIRVPALSMKVCRPASGVLIGLKSGTCKVTVTVTPKVGRAKSKTLTLKL